MLTKFLFFFLLFDVKFCIGSFEQRIELKLQNLQTQITQIKRKIFENSKPEVTPLRENCANFLISDTFLIQPKFSPYPFMVACDSKTKNGGWTYLLNRFNGSQDFYLSWESYKNGFGNLAGEFWLGLEKIHYLTGYGNYELLIELVDWDSKKVYARYNTFSVGSELEGYNLKILEGYSGDAGDFLSYHAGMKFGTNDKLSLQCARSSKGAWWYRNCKRSQLTGKYWGENVSEENYNTGMYWDTFHGGNYSLKEARMMVRPRDHQKPLQFPHMN